MTSLWLDFFDADRMGALLAGALMIVGGGFGLRHARRMNALVCRLKTTKLSAIARTGAGPVRVRGRAACTETILSPLTKTPCCAYRVEVDEVVGEEEGSAWKSLVKEVSPRFVLKDATGAVEIETTGLDIDVAWSMEHQVIGAPRTPFDQALVAYLPAECAVGADSLVLRLAKTTLIHPETADPRVREAFERREERWKARHQKRTRDQSFRFREMCLLPGQEFEASGTLVLDGAKRRLTRGAEAIPFTLSSATGREMNRRQWKKVRSMALWSAGILIAGVLVLFADLS